MKFNKPVNGKGDRDRSNKKSFDKGYERIFGKKKCSLNHKHTKECYDKRN